MRVVCIASGIPQLVRHSSMLGRQFHSEIDSSRTDGTAMGIINYAVLPDLKEEFQLRQVESELLGAHWLASGEAPTDQY